MISDGNKNALNECPAETSADAEKKNHPASVKRDDKASSSGGSKPVEPVRISREQAENNIPPDRDPDDPVSP
jgi:hypothetical protein